MESTEQVLNRQLLYRTVQSNRLENIIARSSYAVTYWGVSQGLHCGLAQLILARCRACAIAAELISRVIRVGDY